MLLFNHMMIRLFYILPLITAMTFLGGSAAFAQTDDTTTADLAEVDTLVSLSQEADPTYDGIEIETPEENPSRFRLFWRGLRERVSVALTFDASEKTEKALKYAEERLLLAQRAFETAQDERARAQAYDHLEKAKAWLERMRIQQAKALEDSASNAERLLHNQAAQFERQRRIMDRIEQDVDEETQRRVLQLREQMVEEHRRLANAIANEQIPERVREQLSEIRTRIETHAQEVREQAQTFKELVEAAQSGDTEARAELEALKERREEALRKAMEEQQAKRSRFEEEFGMTLDTLFEKAAAGDEAAAALLERIKENPELRRRLNASLQNTDEPSTEIETETESEENEDLREARRLRAERIQKMMESNRGQTQNRRP